VDHLFRHQAGQVVATLTRLLGPRHLGLAEDVVQEALLKALRHWAYCGVPENPAAWLMAVARNHALDLLRRDARLRDRQAALVREYGGVSLLEADTGDDLRDDLLRMMFICCHPAIPREAQVALTLKTLGGFGVPEIARAFLTKEATIAQRLVRAKRAIRQQNLPYAMPEARDLPARLDAVLDALYLLFNEGYGATHGETLVRDDLCAEAIRLTTILAAHPAGDVPKVHALLALMLLHAARLPGRTDDAGDFLTLEAQDRTRWDRALIATGMRELLRAACGNELTAYHLQASIAACHATARTYAETDWPRILAAYDDLMARAPSPVVALNRAVAMAMVRGPEAGLAELETIRAMPGMAAYSLFHATRATFRAHTGDNDGARTAFTDALARAWTEPERRFLRRKRDALAPGDSRTAPTLPAAAPAARRADCPPVRDASGIRARGRKRR
jgi:RNA polymerase sigma-70 factor (ECF subfamily)